MFLCVILKPPPRFVKASGSFLQFAFLLSVITVAFRCHPEFMVEARMLRMEREGFLMQPICLLAVEHVHILIGCKRDASTAARIRKKSKELSIGSV